MAGAKPNTPQWDPPSPMGGRRPMWGPPSDVGAGFRLAGQLQTGSGPQPVKVACWTMKTAVAFYLAGVLAGLVLVDGRPATRIGLALLWPLGPLAFLVTIAGLVLAAMLAFPIFGVVAAAVAAITWWVVR